MRNVGMQKREPRTQSGSITRVFGVFYILLLLSVLCWASLFFFLPRNLYRRFFPPFDPVAWNRSREKEHRRETDAYYRYWMALDLTRKKTLIGKSRDHVIGLLGGPKSGE